MHIVFICVEAALMGAPYAFPQLPPLIGQGMFWAGVAGLVLYPVWLWKRRWLKERMEPWHLINIGIIGAFLFSACALAGVIWQEFRMKPIPVAPQGALAGAPPPVVAVPPSDPRQALLQTRRNMEIAVKDAKGKPLQHQFDKSGIGRIKITEGSITHTVHISKLDALGVWIYDDDNKKLSVVRNAKRGNVIDIRTLRAAQRSDIIRIGDRAFLELNDGSTMQVLLTGVLYYNAGDDLDEARFKYQIYPAGEFLIEAM